MFASWLKHLVGRPLSRATHTRRRNQSRYRPHVEELEERCLLSAAFVNEFAVPTARSYPETIVQGPDGNLWFTEELGNQIGEINAATHVVSEFPVPTANNYVFGITVGITAGPDGNLWFTEYDGAGGGKIGEINPTTHAITEFSLPPGSFADRITVGPDGNLWFTDSSTNQIGEFSLATHAVSEFAIPTANSDPYGITAGPDGNLWFTEQGSNQIGEINPITHAFREFALPANSLFFDGNNPAGITAGPDGNLWFTEYDHIGEINPTTGAINEYSTGIAFSTDITTGPDGNLWFTETGSNLIGQINPTTDAMQEFYVATSDSGLKGITAGPNDTLWFTEQYANNIGEVSFPDVTWVNRNGGDWDTASNWSTGQVPGPADNVLIGIPGITVTHSSAVSESVNNLAITGDAVVFSAGALAVGGQTLVDGGSLSLAGSTGLTSRSLAIQNAGTVSIAGTASVADGLTSVGVNTITGAGTVLANSLTVLPGGTLTDSANLSFSGGGLIYFSGLVVNSPGTLTAASLDLEAGTLSGSGLINVSGTTYLNDGAISLSGTGLDFSTGSLSLPSFGTLSIAGTVSVANAFVIGQSFLQSLYPGFYTFSGSGTIAAPALIIQDGSILTDSANISLSGSALISGAGSKVSITGGSLSAAGLTVIGGGSLNTSGNVAVAGAVLVDAASVSLTSTSVSAQSATVQNGGTLVDSGDLTLTCPAVVTGPGSEFSAAALTITDAALTAGAFTPPVATEGTPFSNVTVFHFTDAEPSVTASDYSAVITWGDGTTSTITSTASAAGQIVANATGGFDVQASHSYAEEMSGETFSVVVSDDCGCTASASTNTFSVADANLTGGAFTPPVATEGAPFSSVTLLHFTDTDPNATDSNYRATITWGDGTTSTVTSTPNAAGQIVANAAGGFDVQASHTYAEEMSGNTFSVVVTDAGGATASASTNTFRVADAALTVGAVTPPVVVEGAPFRNVTVFHFTDADPNGTAADYSAIITWGDGTTSTVTSTLSTAGQIVPNVAGGFDVQVSHTYAEQFSGQTFRVVVSDAGGATASASTNTFSVADAALTAGAFTSPVAVEGTAFSNVTVLHFTDADPNGTASDYSAVITWGDGTTSTVTSAPSAAGQIVDDAAGGFDVQASHAYAEEISGQNFSVVVSDAGGATASASTNAFGVADAALTATNVAFTATEGSAFTGVVASFTDPGADTAAEPTMVPSDYTATISWGDGTSSAGMVKYAGTPGSFTVDASSAPKLYAEEGVYSGVHVMIRDAGGASITTANTSTTVLDAPLIASNVAFTATEGTPFTGLVARFYDSDRGTATDPTTNAADYKATIFWGDGTSSVGTVKYAGTPGNFTVDASGAPKLYAEEGSYNDVHVSITETNTTPGVVILTGPAATPATVHDAQLKGAGVSLTGWAPETFDGTVATFTDSDRGTRSDPTTGVADYKATVSWGDGTSSQGTIVHTANGRFAVVGMHEYQTLGSYTIRIHIVDRGGASLELASSITVGPHLIF